MQKNDGTFRMVVPKSPKMTEIEEGYNKLINLSNELGRIRNELNEYSSLSIHRETNKKFWKKFRLFEKEMGKWRAVANDLYGQPTGLKIEKLSGVEASTSIIHFMNAIFMMMSEINYIYQNEKQDYWKVVNNVKHRKSLTIAGISMGIGLLSIALQI